MAERSSSAADDPQRTKEVFYWLLWVWCWLQFGHGSNMGVATTFGAEGKTGSAEAFVLASWVCVGACVGLPCVSPLLRSSNRYRILVCGLGPLIIACIALMFVPSMVGHYNLRYLYFARFAVGLAEAPILPWITDWLNAYSNDWTGENTIIHIVCPIAETVGFILSSELQAANIPWEWNFVLQIVAIAFGLLMLAIRGGRQYLTRSGELKEAEADFNQVSRAGRDCKVAASDSTTGSADDDSAAPLTRATKEVEEDGKLGSGAPDGSTYFAQKPHWIMYWSVNFGLAASMFAGCAIKFAVKAFFKDNFPDLSIHQVMALYVTVVLIGPGGGAGLSSQGLKCLIAPEDFRQHRKTLQFMTIMVVMAAPIGVLGVWASTWKDVLPEGQRLVLFMASLIASTFLSAMAFPCAQALINNSLGVSWAIFASSSQTLVNNVVSNVPCPWVTGYLIDIKGASFSMVFGMCCLFVTAVLFAIGLLASMASDVHESDDEDCVTSEGEDLASE